MFLNKNKSELNQGKTTVIGRTSRQWDLQVFQNQTEKTVVKNRKQDQGPQELRGKKVA